MLPTPTKKIRIAPKEHKTVYDLCDDLWFYCCCFLTLFELIIFQKCSKFFDKLAKNANALYSIELGSYDKLKKLILANEYNKERFSNIRKLCIDFEIQSSALQNAQMITTFFNPRQIYFLDLSIFPCIEFITFFKQAINLYYAQISLIYLAQKEIDFFGEPMITQYNIENQTNYMSSLTYLSCTFRNKFNKSNQIIAARFINWLLIHSSSHKSFETTDFIDPTAIDYLYTSSTMSKIQNLSLSLNIYGLQRIISVFQQIQYWHFKKIDISQCITHYSNLEIQALTTIIPSLIFHCNQITINILVSIKNQKHDYVLCFGLDILKTIKNYIGKKKPHSNVCDFCCIYIRWNGIPVYSMTQKELCDWLDEKFDGIDKSIKSFNRTDIDMLKNNGLKKFSIHWTFEGIIKIEWKNGISQFLDNNRHISKYLMPKIKCKTQNLLYFMVTKKYSFGI